MKRTETSGHKRGDLFIQHNGPDHFELNRIGRPDAHAQVFTADELRWLMLAAAPALIAEHAPPPTAVQAARAKGLTDG